MRVDSSWGGSGVLGLWQGLQKGGTLPGLPRSGRRPDRLSQKMTNGEPCSLFSFSLAFRHEELSETTNTEIVIPGHRRGDTFFLLHIHRAVPGQVQDTLIAGMTCAPLA